jgi:hypothetical protein
MNVNAVAVAVERLPVVEAELNYLAPSVEKPRTYAYDPPAGVPKSNILNEAHRLPIHDLRPIADSIRLDREGFQLVRQTSAVGDFYDDDEIRRVYYPEAERFLKEVTGAERVFIFDHTVRRRVPGA